MKTILKIDFMGKGYGGNAYERLVFNALKENCEIHENNILNRGSLMGSFLAFFRLLITSKFKKNEILLLNFLTAPFFSFFKNNNYLIIHHIDWSYSNWYSKIYQIICWKIILLNKNRWEKIIVVSLYWKNYLEKRGFKNVYVIYNVCDIHEPNSEDISRVLVKYSLLGKDLIYLGNPQRGKGWLESYNALSQMDFLFVLSGNADSSFIKLPKIVYLNLEYKEYLCVLKACKIAVLMSKFKEGWNRAAHECMQLGVPVIGSGEGGMEELLLNGKQLICRDLSDLTRCVNLILANHEDFLVNGKLFVNTLTLDHFNQAWINIIRN